MIGSCLPIPMTINLLGLVVWINTIKSAAATNMGMYSDVTGDLRTEATWFLGCFLGCIGSWCGTKTATTQLRAFYYLDFRQ